MAEKNCTAKATGCSNATIAVVDAVSLSPVAPILSTVGKNPVAEAAGHSDVTIVITNTTGLVPENVAVLLLPKPFTSNNGLKSPAASLRQGFKDEISLFS